MLEQRGWEGIEGKGIARGQVMARSWTLTPLAGFKDSDKF